MILDPLGTGSDEDVPDGGSELLGGVDGVSCVITPVSSYGFVLMLIKAALVTLALSGLGVTALALFTIPFGGPQSVRPR